MSFCTAILVTILWFNFGYFPLILKQALKTIKKCTQASQLCRPTIINLRKPYSAAGCLVIVIVIIIVIVIVTIRNLKKPFSAAWLSCHWLLGMGPRYLCHCCKVITISMFWGIFDAWFYCFYLYSCSGLLMGRCFGPILSSRLDSGQLWCIQCICR